MESEDWGREGRNWEEGGERGNKQTVVPVESLSLHRLFPLQHDPSLEKEDGQSLKIVRREHSATPPTSNKRKTREESPAPEKKSKQK